MTSVPFESHRRTARELDAADPLRRFRDQFHIPLGPDGDSCCYMLGNSLGLQPRRTEHFVQEELRKWRQLAVRAHFEGDHPWMPYHQFATSPMAKLLGARDSEVVMMNSLTVNLHLMLQTLYWPRDQRRKILIESRAFPSDHYAVESHLRCRGIDPQESLVIAPLDADGRFDCAALAEWIESHADSLALVLLPGVQYYTGQVFPMRELTQVARKHGIIIGWDLAHAAGNLDLSLHDWGVDFAVWCSYKYLNAGPGSIGGCFLHERHAQNVDLPRLAGWWGHDPQTRFAMGPDFQPIPTVEGWQLSNPCILSLAAMRAALEVFHEAGGMRPLREKSIALTGFLLELLSEYLADRLRILTPSDPEQRGCQLSLEILGPRRGRTLVDRLGARGILCDWREPNVIRVAPVPLYNTFEDTVRFAEALWQLLTNEAD